MTDDCSSSWKAECSLCTWAETWTTRLAARSAAVWHAYNTHPKRWAEVVGPRPPQDGLPQNQGQRLEPVE